MASKKKQTNAIKKPKPPPKMVIRRNAAPASPKPAKPRQTEQAPTASDRTPVVERLQDMGGTHVAAGVGAGVVGNIAGVVAVGQGWLSPKVTAGVLIGTGAIATAAGYYYEADHIMVTGAGLTTAGTFSLINQWAVDGYEAAENRAKKKQEEREEKDKQKRLAEARALLEADAKKAAAKPHLTIVGGR